MDHPSVIDIAARFAEMILAIFLTDRFLRAYYLPRFFGFFWWFVFSWAWLLLILVHPWGVLLWLVWPLWWPAYPRQR